MKKELDDALCRDFPLLYRDRYGDMRHTCMCWGFPGDGWEPLIRRLSEKLESVIQSLPAGICVCGHPHCDNECGFDCPAEEPDQWYRRLWFWVRAKVGKPVTQPCGCTEFYDHRLRAAQVKEKFGALRFYVQGSTGDIDIEPWIRAAEEESSRTCEDCGAPGVLRGGGWMVTQCDACAGGKPPADEW